MASPRAASDRLALHAGSLLGLSPSRNVKTSSQSISQHRRVVTTSYTTQRHPRPPPSHLSTVIALRCQAHHRGSLQDLPLALMSIIRNRSHVVY